VTDHESSDPQGELFNMPSYQDWLNKMNSHLDAKQVPPVTTQRAWLAAAETPLKFFIAVAYRAAVPGTRSYLRRQGRKAIRDSEGRQQYLDPKQIELPGLLSFLIANHDRRLADARSERDFVARWCEAHTDHTPQQLYKLAGVPMPKVA